MRPAIVRDIFIQLYSVLLIITDAVSEPLISIIRISWNSLVSFLMVSCDSGERFVGIGVVPFASITAVICASSISDPTIHFAMSSFQSFVSGAAQVSILSVLTVALHLRPVVVISTVAPLFWICVGRRERSSVHRFCAVTIFSGVAV